MTVTSMESKQMNNESNDNPPNAVDQMEVEWWIKLNALDGTVPNTLHHYTNLQSLCGIIENKELRATNVKYLNDYTEILHGLNIAIGLCNEILKDELNDSQKVFINSIIQSQDVFLNTDIYVVSLCENEDMLSQWRGYGDKHRSVCIGFNTDKLDFHTKVNPYCPTKLNRVIYDINEQGRLIFEFIRDYIVAIKDLPIEFAVKNNPVKLYGLLILLARMKNPAWNEEKEWRLIFGAHESVFPVEKLWKAHFRCGPYSLLPYIKANVFNGNPFSSLIFPSGEFYGKNLLAAKRMLYENNFNPEETAIRNSRTPIIF